MTFFPIELLLDILQPIELNEIERSQLVCKHWNRTILRYKKELDRRRRIYRLKFLCHPFRKKLGVNHYDFQTIWNVIFSIR